MQIEVGAVLQHRRVLIVDDQRPTRRGLHALLAQFPGIAWIGEATDGRQAVALVAEQRPDVVLMDLRMQGMDGLQATRLIKSQHPEIKVIVLTMYTEYQVEALAAGADLFLLKGGPTAALQLAIADD